MELWHHIQRNDGQKPPSLPHAKACSNYENLHGTLIYSTQILHRKIMSIFTKQYQHITELPSFVQDVMFQRKALRLNCVTAILAIVWICEKGSKQF